MLAKDRAELSALPPAIVAGLTVYGEARGEPVLGMLGVLSVLHNRAAAKNRTLAEIAFQPYQFSCWNENDPNFPMLLQAARASLAGTLGFDAVRDVCCHLGSRLVEEKLSDVTAGATHYHAVTIPAPIWTRTPAKCTVQIGRHRFFSHVAW
jgi:hypothetical protein